jgi:GntR family transcriptional regulator
MPTNLEPHYRRIMADIRRRIAAGEFAPGAELPSTRAIAEMYGVAPGRVRWAITLMIESGELRGHQGLGGFVSGAPQGSSERDRPGRMGAEPYDRRSSYAALTPDRASRDRITAK